MIGGKVLDEITIDLRDRETKQIITIFITIWDSSLSRKWLTSLEHLLANDYVLEKNYCFLGFADSERSGKLILDQINDSISAINASDLGYEINEHFTLENSLQPGPVGPGLPGLFADTDKFNRLHRYFEDLQGISGNISGFAAKASPAIKWHIRQLNLLCHEFESWALSNRQKINAPEWQRPSQLMCWLNAPRFALDQQDFELFGLHTLHRPTGAVYVGVNKAVGKHHYEVYKDEHRSVQELTTTTLRGQTEACGDFDIEWAQDTSNRQWQIQDIDNFRQWLIDNKFDPEDPELTIGFPQIGQVDLIRSFQTQDFCAIWAKLCRYLDVYSISTSHARAVYDYHWSDDDFRDRQILAIAKGK